MDPTPYSTLYKNHNFIHNGMACQLIGGRVGATTAIGNPYFSLTVIALPQLLLPKAKTRGKLRK